MECDDPRGRLVRREPFGFQLVEQGLDFVGQTPPFGGVLAAELRALAPAFSSAPSFSAR
jgi:hypothetical protein